jgi:hypothetical protein
MEWLSRLKGKLLILEVVAILCAAAVLFAVRAQGHSEVQPAQLGLMALPWLVAFVAGILLIYSSWFSRTASSSLGMTLKKIVFWLFSCGTAFVFIAFYSVFVFGLG